MSFLILGCWSLLAWVPVGGLLRIGLAPADVSGQCSSAGQAGDCRSAAAVDDRPRTPAAGSFRAAGPGRGGGALPAGLAAVAQSGWCAWLEAGAAPSLCWRCSCLRWLPAREFWPWDGPPCCARDSSSASLEWTRAGLWMERIALAFDPFFLPGLLVFVGACLAFLPRRLATRLEPPGRDDASTRRVDQFRIAGAGRGPAVWHVWRRARAIPLATMVLWGTLVATAITPALVLAPTLESRPIGPGIVVLIDQPDDSRAQAAALALAVIVLRPPGARLGIGARRPRGRSRGRGPCLIGRPRRAVSFRRWISVSSRDWLCFRPAGPVNPDSTF